MMIKTVDDVIESFRDGQNIFRRPSVELLVREIERLQAEKDQACGWVLRSEGDGEFYGTKNYIYKNCQTNSFYHASAKPDYRFCPDCGKRIVYKED